MYVSARKKQTTLPSFACAGMPYHVVGWSTGAQRRDEPVEALAEGAVGFRHGDLRERRGPAAGLLRSGLRPRRTAAGRLILDRQLVPARGIGAATVEGSGQ